MIYNTHGKLQLRNCWPSSFLIIFFKPFYAPHHLHSLLTSLIICRSWNPNVKCSHGFDIMVHFLFMHIYFKYCPILLLKHLNKLNLHLNSKVAHQLIFLTRWSFSCSIYIISLAMSFTLRNIWKLIRSFYLNLNDIYTYTYIHIYIITLS